MAIEIKKLYNGNVYLDGVSHFGTFEEVTLPEIKTVDAEHKALGMIGKMEFPTGFDKMTCKIKWNGPVEDSIIQSADIYNGHDLCVFGSRESWDAAGGKVGEDLFEAVLRVRPKGAGAIGLKPMDDADLETEWAVSYYQLSIGGVELVCIDVANSYYAVNGIDQLEVYRANLGI